MSPELLSQEKFRMVPVSLMKREARVFVGILIYVENF